MGRRELLAARLRSLRGDSQVTHPAVQAVQAVYRDLVTMRKVQLDALDFSDVDKPPDWARAARAEAEINRLLDRLIAISEDTK